MKEWVQENIFATRQVLLSVVSGKGGTGKSLLSAALGSILSKEGAKVLLVDFDIHVRGLTILLSSYLKNLDKRRVTISEFISNHYTEGDKLKEFAVCRFGSCDFIPSVREIDERFEYSDSQYSREFNTELASSVREFIMYNEYDIVIFDCRAGIDNNMRALSEISDYVISVAEDDDVCLQTNENLINHLKYVEKLKGVRTIINKAKRIKDTNELNERYDQERRHNTFGVIPFDMDVMEDFGKDRFWERLEYTLYYYSICLSWNKLAREADLMIVPEPKSRMRDSYSGRLSSVQRFFRVYGLATGFASVIMLFWILFRYVEIFFDPLIILTIMLSLVSIFSFILSSTNFRSLLFGKYDKPERKTSIHDIDDS